MLLLPQPVQELVRLGQDLWHQGVLVEVLDVEDLLAHLVVLVGRLVDVRHQVLILQVDPPELFVVVGLGVELRRLVIANDLLQVHSGYFLR